MIDLYKFKKRWYDENYDFGRSLGYPECCVQEFCDQPPELMQATIPTKSDRLRFKAAHVNGEYTGFIPCKEHAKQVLSGEITLQSLIKNRDEKFPPFPNV